MSIARKLNLKARSGLRIASFIGGELKQGRFQSALGYACKAAALIVANRVPALRKRASQPHFEETNAFDQEHGVDTTRAVPVSDMEVSSPNAAYGSPYLPSSPALFREILHSLDDLAFSEFAFVDCGSGKGLTLLLASEFPFRKIIGVEFGADLHRRAQENLRRFQSLERPWQRCRDIESVCADAASWPLPLMPTVFYLYNPFEEKVLAAFLDHVEESWRAAPRPLVFIYVEPRYAGAFKKRTFLREIRGVTRDLSHSYLVFMATYVYETIPQEPGQEPKRYELQQRMSDPPLTKHPETGEPIRRVISGGSGMISHGASILSMNTKKR